MNLLPFRQKKISKNWNIRSPGVGMLFYKKKKILGFPTEKSKNLPLSQQLKVSPISNLLNRCKKMER